MSDDSGPAFADCVGWEIWLWCIHQEELLSDTFSKGSRLYTAGLRTVVLRADE